MKKRQTEDSVFPFIEKARKVKELKKQGQIEQATTLYNSLKLEYIGLSNEEKAKVFKEIKQMAKSK